MFPYGEVFHHNEIIHKNEIIHIVSQVKLHFVA